MISFMKILRKISFTAYLFTLKNQFIIGSIEGASAVLSKKDSLKATGEKIDNSIADLKKNIAAIALNVAGTTKQTSEGFLAKPAATQMSLLQGAADCKTKIEQARKSTGKLYDEYKAWSNDMIHVFVIKKSRVSSSKIKALSEAVGMDEKQMKSIIKIGKTIDNLTYEEAVSFQYVFSSYGVDCYYGLHHIDKRIKSLHYEHVSNTALEKAYFSAALWTRSIWAVLVGIFFMLLVETSESPIARYVLFPLGFAAAVFFILWGIQKLFSFILVPVSNFIVGKIMKKVEKTYEMSLSDYINEEFAFFAPLSEKILTDINNANAKLGNIEKDVSDYIYAFFPKKLPMSFVSFVAGQMKTGCNFSEGCWRAEQTMAQQQWQAEKRKKQEALENEEKAWRSKMLESQKRVEAYRKQQALEAKRTADQTAARTQAIREVSATYRELTNSLRKGY